MINNIFIKTWLIEVSSHFHEARTIPARKRRAGDKMPPVLKPTI